jgi:hypothetical protein
VVLREQFDGVDVAESDDREVGAAPAVAGGWRKGTNRPYLALTDDVIAAHLTGGLYPLLDGIRVGGWPWTSTARRPCSTRCRI